MRKTALFCVFQIFCFLELSAFFKQEKLKKHSLIILNPSSLTLYFYYGKTQNQMSFYKVKAFSAAVFPLKKKSDLGFFKFKSKDNVYFLNHGKYYLVFHLKKGLKIYKKRFYSPLYQNQYHFLVGIWYWGENPNISKNHLASNTFLYEFYPNKTFLTINKKTAEKKKGKWRIFKLGNNLYLELLLNNGYKNTVKIKKINENALIVHSKNENRKVLNRLMGYY